MIKIISTVSSMLFIYVVHAQNVGIGTVSPQRAKLEVHGVSGTGSTTAVFSAPAGGGVSIQSYWPTIGFNQYRDANDSKFISDGYAAVQYLDPHNGGIFFDVYPTPGFANLSAGTQRRAMAILRNGNVALGTSPSNSAFSVSRNSWSDATACFFGSTHNSFFNWSANENTYIRAGKDNGIVYINDIPGSRVILHGRVGINTATPATTLEIRQQGNTGLALVDPEYFNAWEFRVINDPTAELFLFYNGIPRGLFAYDDGRYLSFSDARLKTNIRPLSETLGKVMQLEPVEYEMKDNNPAREKTLGFIAQDVKKLFPEMVTVLPDTTGGHGITDVHALDYDGFGVLAIKALQEQQKLILEQQAQIDELKKTVNGLFRQFHKRE